MSFLQDGPDGPDGRPQPLKRSRERRRAEMRKQTQADNQSDQNKNMAIIIYKHGCFSLLWILMIFSSCFCQQPLRAPPRLEDDEMSEGPLHSSEVWVAASTVEDGQSAVVGVQVLICNQRCLR